MPMTNIPLNVETSNYLKQICDVTSLFLSSVTFIVREMITECCDVTRDKMMICARTCSSEEGAVEVEGAAGGEDPRLPVVIIVLFCHGVIIIIIIIIIIISNVRLLLLELAKYSIDTKNVSILDRNLII